MNRIAFHRIPAIRGAAVAALMLCLLLSVGPLARQSAARAADAPSRTTPEISASMISADDPFTAKDVIVIAVAIGMLSIFTIIDLSLNFFMFGKSAARDGDETHSRRQRKMRVFERWRSA